MKYIIEIEEEPFGRNDDPVIPHGMDELYRAKGFNSLVFDQFGLDKLTPLDTVLEEVLEGAYQKGFEVGQHEATTLEYKQGLNDAWEAITKIAKMYDGERGKIFGDTRISNILNKYSVSEIIDKLKAYEEQQKPDEIKVGDELQANDDPSVKIIVSQVRGNTIWGFNSEGNYSSRPIFDWHKTGRSFPQVAESLEAMKGGAE